MPLQILSEHRNEVCDGNAVTLLKIFRRNTANVTVQIAQSVQIPETFDPCLIERANVVS